MGLLRAGAQLPAFKRVRALACPVLRSAMQEAAAAIREWVCKLHAAAQTRKRTSCDIRRSSVSTHMGSLPFRPTCFSSGARIGLFIVYRINLYQPRVNFNG